MLLYSYTFKRHIAKRKCQYTEAKIDTTTVHLRQLLSITTSQVSHPLSTHNNNGTLMYLHFPLCCKTSHLIRTNLEQKYKVHMTLYNAWIDVILHRGSSLPQAPFCHLFIGKSKTLKSLLCC